MTPQRTTPEPPAFGLLAWLDNTRIALPLKGVECRWIVTGAVASVELDQIYHQNATRPLDCVYTFPLPDGAAVYRCEVHLPDRVLRAQVRDRESARQEFAARKAAGHRAALVETERDNLFTLTLGNLQPGDVLVVRFAWFQVLERNHAELRMRVPVCPGVRYIPGRPLLRGASGLGTADDTDQVPDASRLSPPRIDALHPDAAYFSIEGRVALSDVEPGTLSSPSHAVRVGADETSALVTLATEGTVPDRDFVLLWQEPAARQLQPAGWHWQTPEGIYALVQLRAPAAVERSAQASQDYYFLVDRSGSMDGTKWTGTCKAVQGFVRLLRPDDRVWITLFESDFLDFAEAPWPASRVLADTGFAAMEDMGVAGGTELLPAAVHVLQKIAAESAGRRAHVIVITDGQMGNEKEILRAFQAAPQVVVHTFGIDTAVNDSFLRALARQGRGGCWLQTPDDDIAGTIASLGDRLQHPVLTDLVAPGWESADQLPDLYATEIATLALRAPAGEHLELTGLRGDGTTRSFTVELGTAGSAAIPLLWARRRIDALLAGGERAEAIALSIRHNILCAGTAFIAWDEAEKVAIAADTLVQPAMEPERCSAGGAMPMMARCASPMPSGMRLSEAIPRYWRKTRGADSSFAQLPKELAAAGLNEATGKAIATWVTAKTGDPHHRAEMLRAVLAFIAGLEAWPAPGGPAAELREQLTRVAAGTIGAGLEPWLDYVSRTFETLVPLCQNLIGQGAPVEPLRRVLLLALGGMGLHSPEVAQFVSVTSAPVRTPFSTSGREAFWKNLFAFLQPAPAPAEEAV